MPVSANIMIKPIAQPLPPSLGGTGKSNLRDAITSMLPPQSGNSGKVLTTDGYNLSWASVSSSSTQGSGTVTSVSITGNSGISVTGSPITTSGTVNISLSPSGATPGQYSNPTITVDSTGRITSVSSGSSQSSGVASFNSRTGNVVLTSGDIISALVSTAIPIASGGTGATSVSGILSNILPSQTGNFGKVLSTDGANLSWVTPPGASGSAGVSSFNGRDGIVSLSQTDVTSVLSTSSTSVINTVGNSNSSSILITREANYSGGTPGFVNSALFVDTTVGSSSNSNQKTFEWGITSRIKNYTDYGENVAIYGQGNRISGNGPIWGMVAEATDMTNSNTTVSTSGTVGLEVDVWANGTDEFERRIGIDVVVGNAQQIRNNTPGISKGYAYDGIRVGPQSNNINLGEFKYGLNILNGGGQTAAVVSQANGTRGIWLKGNNEVGLELSGTYSSSAIRIPSNSSISFDPTDNIRIKYNPNNALLEFFSGSTRRGYIDMANGADNNLSSGSTTSAVTLTGDVTGTGTSTVNTSLSSTGVTPGTYGSSNKSLTVAVDSKGRISSVSESNISVSWASITDKPTTLAGYGITDGGSGAAPSGDPLVLNHASISSSEFIATTATPNQVIDQFDITEFRTVKYLIQVSNSQSYQSGELLVMHNGIEVVITEFSGLVIGNMISSFDSDISGNTARLLASPTSSNTLFKIVRTGVII